MELKCSREQNKGILLLLIASFIWRYFFNQTRSEAAQNKKQNKNQKCFRSSEFGTENACYFQFYYAAQCNFLFFAIPMMALNGCLIANGCIIGFYIYLLLSIC